MKKFKTHNESNEIDTCDTSLMGHVSIDYNKLVETFGEPFDGCDKTDVEWEIEFSDDKVATIYNYKDGFNYLGRSGMSVENITDWHVGGFDPVVVGRISKILGLT